MRQEITHDQRDTEMTAKTNFVFKVDKKNSCQHVIEYSGTSFTKHTSSTSTIYGYCGICGTSWKGVAKNSDIDQLSEVNVTEVEEIT